MQIPPIKITSKGETYYINRATNITNPRHSLNEDQEYSAINEMKPTRTKAGRWQPPTENEKYHNAQMVGKLQ